MSHITYHEKLVDQTMEHFFKLLDYLFVKTNDVCDFGHLDSIFCLGCN
jgi:hypothetical protein